MPIPSPRVLPRRLRLDAVLTWLAEQGPTAIAATPAPEDGLLWRYWRAVLHPDQFNVIAVQPGFATILTDRRVYDVDHGQRLALLAYRVDHLAATARHDLIVADVLGMAYQMWAFGGAR